MAWQLRHTGSPKSVSGLTAQEIVDGLRDGSVDPQDEVIGPGGGDWRAIENHPQFTEVLAEMEEIPTPRHDEDSSIDMNSVIDVTFVMLIFFILAATYATIVQKVIPLASVEQKKKVRSVKRDEIKKHMIRMNAQLDAKGKAIIRIENQTVQVVNADGETVDAKKMRDILQPYVQGPDRKTEILFESQKIPWGLVVALQDAARTAGVRTVHHVLPKE